MTEPTPQSNKVEITELKGDVKTLHTKVDAERDLLKLSVGNLEKTAERMELSQSEFMRNESHRASRTFKKIEQLDEKYQKEIKNGKTDHAHNVSRLDVIETTEAAKKESEEDSEKKEMFSTSTIISMIAVTVGIVALFWRG